MTSFYHTKEHVILHFWKIDADDMMFLTPPDKTAVATHKVATKAQTESKTVVSYDMWFNYMPGRHWSFGVIYISGISDFTCIFEGLKDRSRIGER